MRVIRASWIKGAAADSGLALLVVTSPWANQVPALRVVGPRHSPADRTRVVIGEQNGFFRTLREGTDRMG